MYKKILVPLDGSDLAECALSHVKSLVEDGSVGEVTLLNIVWFDLPWIDEYPATHRYQRDQGTPLRRVQKVSGRGGIPVEFQRDQGKNGVP